MDNADRLYRIAITGAGGYLGGNLANLFEEKGFVVYRLTSSDERQNQSDPLTINFCLSGSPLANVFANNRINTLIHCAYDFSLCDWREIEQVNVRGSIELMKAAKAQGVERIVFISTMSAFDNCRSMYGKAKLEIEQEAARLEAVVIRPGLIYSDQPSAMMGKLTTAVCRLPLLPDISGGSQMLYLVHLDDLMFLIYSVVTGGIGGDQPIIAASDQGRTLSEILKVIAKREHKSIHMVSVPWKLIWFILRVLEIMRLKLGFRSDSIVSLVNQDPAPKFDLTCETGITFREFS